MTTTATTTSGSFQRAVSKGYNKFPPGTRVTLDEFAYGWAGLSGIVVSARDELPHTRHPQVRVRIDRDGTVGWVRIMRLEDEA